KSSRNFPVLVPALDPGSEPGDAGRARSFLWAAPARPRQANRPLLEGINQDTICPQTPGAAMLRWFNALMPREERFFDLFARHSETVAAGAKALRDMLEGGDAVARNYKTV